MTAASGGGSIRRKLLAMVLLPLLGVLPLLGLLLLWWGDAAFDSLLITKIRADLAVAQGYFERVRDQVGTSTAAVADSHALGLALARARVRNDDTALVALLQQARERAGLDFINLRAPDGRLRATDSGLSPTPDRGQDAAGQEGPAWPASAADPLPPERTSLAVLPPADLQRLAPRLHARVAVPLVPTRNAAPTTRQVEDRALVLLAERTVRDDAGRVLGHVQGGVLLNRNLPFIDHINQIVYPDGSLPFGSRGTATLFLDDVRVSTNVRLFDPEGPTADRGEGTDRADRAETPEDNGRGSRAIGTRVSQEVRRKVLDEGRTWLDRAFVVSDWYVSAYQPLADDRGQRVGMLYVGFLERPFTLLKYGVLAAIGVIFFAVMIVAAIVSLRWARTVFRPIEQMEATMRAVEAGALETRVGTVGSDDEIGRLARHLDRLLDVIDDKARALQRWNVELDAKVAQRTQALEARTAELAAAQGQLLRSEKLAAVGQLTASVAHEINNPIAVIQGNLDLLRSLLPDSALASADTELRLLDQQVERMRLIVTQLLQFARPGEFVGYVAPVELGRVCDDCLVLTGHLLARTRIELRRNYTATRQPAINRNELQQVLVNLIVNAIHAMPEGGTLTLGTHDEAGDGHDEAGGEAVAITVSDTGAGLGAELMHQLFQPFVTRKQDGTGLGLWISRSLVQRYGGDLTGANRDDVPHGARFTVRLRCEPDLPGH